MRAFSFAVVLLVISFSRVAFCGYLNVRQVAIGDGPTTVVGETKMVFINCPVYILVLNDNFSYYASVSHPCGVESIICYRRRVVGSRPFIFSWDQRSFAGPLGSSAEVSISNAYIIKYPNMKSRALPVVFQDIIPVELSGVSVIDNVDFSAGRESRKCKYGSLVESKVSTLLPQLAPESGGGDSSKNSGYYSSNPSDFSPLSYLAGNCILGFLFFCALTSGVAAYYIDEKWPEAGWIPLAIFAIIAFICAVQLSRLADGESRRDLASFDRRSEDIRVLAVVIPELETMTTRTGVWPLQFPTSFVATARTAAMWSCPK